MSSLLRYTRLSRGITATPPTPPPSGDPTPSGTILIDTRSGGNANIQTSTTFAQARTALYSACRDINGSGGYCEFVGGYAGSSGNVNGSLPNDAGLGGLGWNFTTNVDGANTRAFRVDRRGWADAGPSYTPTVGDNNMSIVPYIPLVSGAAPTELYIQWKHRMGRTATGGGYNDTLQAGGVDRSSVIDRFAIVNEDHVPSNASRKYLLINRPSGSSPNGRIDMIWAGDWTTVAGATRGVQVEVSSPTQSPTPPIFMIPRSTWNPLTAVATTITYTTYIKAESSVGAGDGIMRVWVNGTQIGEKLNWGILSYGFDRIEFPNIINSPKYTQTEYFWDIVIWKP